MGFIFVCNAVEGGGAVLSSSGEVYSPFSVKLFEEKRTLQNKGHEWKNRQNTPINQSFIAEGAQFHSIKVT